VFATDLRRRLLECQQYNVPLALMFVEIDDLSQLINDSGPTVGEMTLKTYSDLVSRSLTDMDVVSRLGGRLAIMMPGTNLQGAVRAAERVRVAATACRVKVRGEEIKCTASIGVTEVMAGDTPASLSQRADSALLASKAAGKNCTHAHDGAYCGLVRGATGSSAPHLGSVAAAVS
jgi:diguanylate cyclase (GGDEF)-like protein